MIKVVFAIALISLLVGASIGYQSNRAILNKLEEVSGENERLRLFNARQKRRLDMPLYMSDKKFAEPDKEAVAIASHILGCPESVIAAVWKQENGPPDIETGSLGKTDFFVKNFPLKDWPALEAGRTMNLWCWDWFLTTDGGRQAMKVMLAHIAKPYTGLDLKEQKDWAKRVAVFQKGWR